MFLKAFLLFLVFSVALTQRNENPPRVFKERVRNPNQATTIAPEVPDDAMETEEKLEALAKVQKDQAESFRLWASQFQIFKNNVWKFMNETNDILRKNDKKVKALQILALKIVKEMND